jgi:hypothetical protein
MQVLCFSADKPAMASSGIARPRLAGVISSLDQSAQVSFILDAGLRLAYCNQAWNRFAVDNAAPE